jgi:hypothetical protein
MMAPVGRARSSGDSLAQFRDTGAGTVLVVAAEDLVGGDPQHLGRAVLVGESLPEVSCAWVRTASAVIVAKIVGPTPATRWAR